MFLFYFPVNQLFQKKISFHCNRERKSDVLLLITEGFTSSFLTAQWRNETVLTRVEFYISGQVLA